MKTGIIMKKLFIGLLALMCGMQLAAQNASPLVQDVVMSPNPLKVGQTGHLTANVKNDGTTAITAGCALVSIDVPSAISGAKLTLNQELSDPMWTFKNYGPAGSIVLINSKGILAADAVSFPVVLNVSGDTKGGPYIVQASVSLNLGCSGLSNLKIVRSDRNGKGQTTTKLIVTE